MGGQQAHPPRSKWHVARVWKKRDLTPRRWATVGTDRDAREIGELVGEHHEQVADLFAGAERERLVQQVAIAAPHRLDRPATRRHGLYIDPPPTGVSLARSLPPYRERAPFAPRD